MATATRAFPFSPLSVTEEQWREMVQHLLPSGVVVSVGAKLAVTASAGMVLNVGTGFAGVLGEFAAFDATTTVAVSASNATLPRLDRVVLRLDTVGNTITTEVITGTAAAIPTLPALTQTSATWEIGLAVVYVAATATTINAADISDDRTLLDTTRREQARTIPNPVRNASMQIATRGASVAVGAAAVYGLDGWPAYRTGLVAGLTVSQQLTTDTEGSAYGLRLQRDSGNASTAVNFVYQSLLTADVRRFAGRTATFAIRVKCGANYSAAANLATFSLFSGTGTDQSLRAGLTGQATLATMSRVLTTAYQTFFVTVAVGSGVTQLAVEAKFTPVGTASTNDWIEIKDVRIVEGSTLPPYIPPDVDVEKASCQWLLRQSGGSASADIFGVGLAASATSAQVFWHLNEMRAIPTLSVSNVAHWVCNDSTVNNNSSAVALTGAVSATPRGVLVDFTTTGLTAGRSVRVAANTSSAWARASAEIAA